MLFRKERIKLLKARIAELEEQNAQLRQALEFYADNVTWTGLAKYRDADGITVFRDPNLTPIAQDLGNIARQALRRLGG